MARDDDDFDDDDDDDKVSDKPIKKKRRPSSSGNNTFLDIFLFKKFVGPWILLVLFYLAVVLCILGGIFMVIMAVIAMTRGGGALAAMGILYGFAIILIYPVALRVYFELMICVFRCYETLVEIRDKL